MPAALLLLVLLLSSPAHAIEAVCEALPFLPGSEPGAADLEQQARLCGIDYGKPAIALCPKTWSTSPGAVVYDLGGTGWEDRRDQFERELCAPGGGAREAAHSEPGVFKNSLNGRDTSGTFAPASLLYYHLARWLQTRLFVPVAVRQEFPLQEYRERVAQPGLAFSADSKRLRMLHAGWREMERALVAPADYPGARELFSADHSRLWGIVLHEQGRRYGPEVNGTRASGWGDGQNRDFQRTAPFLALRIDAPLGQALSQALAEARSDPVMAKALPADTPAQQLAWWAGEVAEIALLDYILKQQDRVGNVDYRRRWLSLRGGRAVLSDTRPEGAAVALRATVLNDNDAGVRSGYANYAERTGMLQGWHRADPVLYRRLQALAKDFAGNGAVAQALRANYRLSRREVEGILSRGQQAAQWLRERCEAGLLRFDLYREGALQPGAVEPRPADCAAN